jgi:S-layer homology domain
MDGMNPMQMADFIFQAYRPSMQMQIAIDNLILRQTVRDTAKQPQITPLVSDAQADGALFIDWRSYPPATSTVAYRVYVSEQPGAPITSLTPVLHLDAVAQSTLLRTSLNLSLPGQDPEGYNILPNGQPFFVTVVAVDFWGNLGAVALSVGATPSECGITFSDVPPGYFAYTAIYDLACLGIVSGVGGLFQPNANTARDEFAEMITLTRGWTIIDPQTQTFSDVPPSSQYYVYVETAYANHAISGADAPTCSARGLSYPCFLPVDPITRAQIAVIIFRAYGWAVDTTGGPHFDDVPPTHFAYTAVETCYNRGVVMGTGYRQYIPNQNTTRAQAAVMLYLSLRQFQDLVPDGVAYADEGDRP